MRKNILDLISKKASVFVKNYQTFQQSIINNIIYF